MWNSTTRDQPVPLKEYLCIITRSRGPLRSTAELFTAHAGYADYRRALGGVRRGACARARAHSARQRDSAA